MVNTLIFQDDLSVQLELQLDYITQIQLYLCLLDGLLFEVSVEIHTLLKLQSQPLELFLESHF